MPRARRHHNNTGARQVSTGRTRDQVRGIAERLRIPYAGDQLDRPGPLFAKRISGSREAVVYPLTFGRARISVCPAP